MAAAASGYRCIWRTCATTQREERDGDLGHSARNAFQRRHAAEANRDTVYTGVCLRHARGMSVSIWTRKIIDTPFPGGITERRLAWTRCTRTLGL